jgi:DNA-binding Lrp family transcriptional regulator
VTARIPKLDRIDLNILVQLQRDGRITNQRLAELVGLSPSPCLQRVRRLISARFISGFGAELNLARLAENITIFTEVTLVDHKQSDFAKFESSIRGIQEVMECHLISGGYDYLIKFMTRNIKEYQSLMEGLLEKNIGIEKYFSYVVLKSPILKREYPLKRLLNDE